MITISNNNEFSNRYLNALIEVIQEKRELSLKEFNKTDLIGGVSIDTLSEWYAQLIQQILKNPPKSYVKKLVVHQKQMEILSIQYIYSENNKPSDSVSISMDNI